MLLKSGVNLNGIHYLLLYAAAMVDAVRLMNGLGQATITGGLEQAPGRKASTLHPRGMALDFRISDLPRGVPEQLAGVLQQNLPGFDVILETDHIHIEVGPSMMLA